MEEKWKKNLRVRKGFLFFIAVLCFIIFFLIGTFQYIIEKNNKNFFSKKELVEDVKQLVEIIENTHPDPYVNVGGRISFHRKVHELIKNIPESGMTKKEFFELLRPFVASLKDGHTNIYVDLSSSQPISSNSLGINFDIVENYLYVTKVSRKEDKVLLGKKLVSIDGVPFEELMRRADEIKGFDNVYHKLYYLSTFLTRSDNLEFILKRKINEDSISIEVSDDGVRKIKHKIPFGNIPIFPIFSKSKIELPKLNMADMGWKFIDKNNFVALLKIGSMTKYREALENWYSMGNFQLLSKILESSPQKYSSKSIEEKIKAFPSATDMFIDLFNLMKKNNTKVLIVDLRDNGGGASFISNILCYFLYGKENKNYGYSVVRYSKLFFEYNKKLKGIEKNIPYQIDDYCFPNENCWNKRKKDETKSNKEDNWLSKIPTFYNVYKSGTYEKFYTPEVIVLTSASTYSSAYLMAEHLYKNGAKIIGISSADSPFSFGEIVEYHLKNSQIYGTVSSKLFIGFPDKPDMKALKPDIELTYKKLKEYNFDPNASVLLALDYISKKYKLKLDFNKVN